jgi:hypothetical protein
MIFDYNQQAVKKVLILCIEFLHLTINERNFYQILLVFLDSNIII